METASGLDVTLTNPRVVAIDGGTATGKGRLIDELSQLMRLKGIPVVHLSTGSLYRAVAYVCLMDIKRRISTRGRSDAQVTKAAVAALREMRPEKMLELAQAKDVAMHGGVVWIGGSAASVEDILKAPGSGTGSSIVSIPVPVREFVNAIARRQANEFDGFVLMDGRDTTHTVVPDASLKLLLTVSAEVAAKRSTEHTIDEIIARDEGDRRKAYGALRHPSDPGEGVKVIATDDHTPESIRDEVYKLMRRQFPELPAM